MNIVRISSVSQKLCATKCRTCDIKLVEWKTGLAPQVDTKVKVVRDTKNLCIGAALEPILES
jgi:hypothetical protein